MKSLRRFWDTSPPEYKDYLFIYAWGAIWALVYLFFTPAATYNLTSTFIVALWAGVAVTGACIAIWGLIFRDNLIVERFGVNLLMIGPMAYALTQLGLLIFFAFAAPAGVEPPTDPLSRLHLVFFALWPYLFLNKRRRQLKSRVKLAKKMPLMGE